MIRSPRLVIIVGGAGSGKDHVIQAINFLGKQHAQIVPKHTTRTRNAADENEMICIDDQGYNLEKCDVKYENYEETYGLKSKDIWNGLRGGVFQVAVISNSEAINHLRKIFGKLMLLVYVHSEIKREDFIYEEISSALPKYISNEKFLQSKQTKAQIVKLSMHLASTIDNEKFPDAKVRKVMFSFISKHSNNIPSMQLDELVKYIRTRVLNYRKGFNIYLDNFSAFDHVLIWSGSRRSSDTFGAKEDLYDEVFRLFRAYELGLIH